MAKVPESSCSITRTLGVLGERWTFLILREAFLGVTRFAELRDRLGVAPDMLSARLAVLTEYGVLRREPYQEPGERSRFAYRLTPAGQELQVILGALQQWGDEHLPHPDGPSMLRRCKNSGSPLHVGYIDDKGREVSLADVRMIPAAAKRSSLASGPGRKGSGAPMPASSVSGALQAKTGRRQNGAAGKPILRTTPFSDGELYPFLLRHGTFVSKERGPMPLAGLVFPRPTLKSGLAMRQERRDIGG